MTVAALKSTLNNIRVLLDAAFCQPEQSRFLDPF